MFHASTSTLFLGVLMAICQSRTKQRMTLAQVFTKGLPAMKYPVKGKHDTLLF